MSKIIIDEAKCDGCGLCISPCVEGALELVNGKAKVVREDLCDGAGVCIGECPQGAISFEKQAQKIELGSQSAAVEGAYSCSRCGASEMNVELLKGRYQGKDCWYCVKCLPTLIHG
ncbi:MAG: 4Fe-4S dicluster domain-containing protein [Candidatus Saccharibacteria bacterium]